MPHSLSDCSDVFKAQFLAGLVERAIVYPYDVLKTRQQLVLPLRFPLLLLTIFFNFNNFLVILAGLALLSKGLRNLCGELSPKQLIKREPPIWNSH